MTKLGNQALKPFPFNVHDKIYLWKKIQLVAVSLAPMIVSLDMIESLSLSNDCSS